MPPNEIAARLPAAPARPGWQSAVANPLNFVLLGVVYSSWAARVPAVRDALQLDAAGLSIALLGGGAGAVLSFPLAASLVRRLGERRADLDAGLIVRVVAGCPGAAEHADGPR